MSEIKSNSLVATDYLIMMLLFACLVAPLLPLRLVYKETILIILILSSISIFVLCIRHFFIVAPQVNYDVISGLMVAYIIYMLFQIFPLPIWLINDTSEFRITAWQTGAYGIRDSATISLDISATIWFCLLFFGYLSVFLTTRSVINTEGKLLFLIMIIFLLGIFQIIFDLLSKALDYHYVSATEIDGHSYRLTGTFINSNNLSALLNLSIASGLALLSIFLNRYKSDKGLINLFMISIAICGLFFLLYGSIQSGSMGGFLSLIVAIGLILMLVLLKYFNLRNLLFLLGFLLSIFSLLVFFGSRELNVEQFIYKLTLSGRPQLWSAVIDMWRDFPIFGVGAGAFEWVFPAYKTDELSPLRVINAHSSYLNLLAETGLVGMTLLIAILSAYLIRITIMIKHKPQLIYITGPLIMGWIAFVIHEGVENNLLLPSVAVPFFCLMALILSLDKIQINKG